MLTGIEKEKMDGLIFTYIVHTNHLQDVSHRSEAIVKNGQRGGRWPTLQNRIQTIYQADAQSYTLSVAGLECPHGETQCWNREAGACCRTIKQFSRCLGAKCVHHCWRETGGLVHLANTVSVMVGRSGVRVARPGCLAVLWFRYAGHSSNQNRWANCSANGERLAILIRRANAHTYSSVN